MNLLGKKRTLETDPLNQPIVTTGDRGERIVVPPFKYTSTAGDEVENFVIPPVTATLPKPRFEIKGWITIR